ncbi:MAG: energy-coupling factor ABC transporter permease [Actinobacteria bacterium]|nr:energy-coupling factor ABC transporter permease [Actinomycetota bacterium]
MHLPDGFLDTTTVIVTGAGALAALTYAVRRTSRELGERTVPLLGVTAAFVFAAQMLNFPIAAGTSGHFLGAAFAAVVMGPWAAVVVLAVVVAVQAVGMADGGISALGANTLNMAVVAVFVGYGAHRALRAILPPTIPWYLAGVAVASWLSVVAASGAVAVELAVSGTVPLRFALPAMTSVHMVIGIGEALITTTVLATVLASRPDLVYSPPRAVGGTTRRRAAEAPPKTWGFLAAALAVALALSVFVSPFASQAPDGLERVAEDQGFAGDAEEGGWSFSPIPDYQFPGLEDPTLATAAAGLVGTLVMFAVLLGLGQAFSGRRKGEAVTEGIAAPSLHPLGGHEHIDHRHSGHTHRGHSHSPHVPEEADPDHHHDHAHGHGRRDGAVDRQEDDS